MLKEPFTSQTARQAGILSGQARRTRAKQLRELERLQASTPQTIEAELNRSTLEELRRCSELMQRCRSPRVFAQLAATKQRLWSLVLPTIGVKKPSRDDRRYKHLPVAIHDWETDNAPPPESAEPPAETLPVPSPDPKPVEGPRPVPSPQSSTSRPTLPIALNELERSYRPNITSALLTTTPQAPPVHAMSAQIDPLPVPATPELSPVPPLAGASSPQPEPKPPVPGSASLPTGVYMPAMVVELKAGLSALYKRTAGQQWTEGEGRLLIEVAKRRNAATELQVIINFYRRLSPQKKSSFPATALALVENWDKVLAYARQHVPR